MTYIQYYKIQNNIQILYNPGLLLFMYIFKKTIYVGINSL